MKKFEVIYLQGGVLKAQTFSEFDWSVLINNHCHGTNGFDIHEVVEIRLIPAAQ